MSYLQNNVSIIIPAGTVISYPGVIDGTNNIPPPSGWLLCDGATYNKSAYPALSTLLVGSYGNTSSGTTFVVPNFQAAFLRGAGTQTYPTSGGTIYGYTSGTTARTINTAQGTDVQSHTHNYTANTNTHNHNLSNFHNHSFTIPQDSANAHSHSATTGNYTVGATSTAGAEWAAQPGLDVRYTKASRGEIDTETGYSNFKVAAASTNLTINNITPTYNSDANTSNTTPNETIPFNYAINWIIKY